MIFYTPDPMEYLAYGQELGEPIILKLPSGGVINAVKDESRQLRILNIVSTDPLDYLNSQYQPGTIIAMQPDWEKLKA
ncbi:MAG: YlzJ-like family protein [Syntrophomonas sp.]|uniref:YlzJ-like family protein n=1 Tax=Syntrophomonas sp. TaxID=2053627 RepID=UPI002610F0EB|nr:YlzJ-like family protein [Syntrophomonas sp.]MDD2509693.1 YlzJ-like family protein [Syntrophomonas sp.]MDD3879289.1 YlzJ-like family protein [Syntrophomonas sp.]MDD4625825.1 YlzJ-like family protein [Syntrophomonas sp.]